jgi:hypothetical protein
LVSIATHTSDFPPLIVAVTLWSLASELEASSEGDPVALAFEVKMEVGGVTGPGALASKAGSV